MESHNRECLSGQDRQGGQHRNSGGQHHHIMHKVCLSSRAVLSLALRLPISLVRALWREQMYILSSILSLNAL